MHALRNIRASRTYRSHAMDETLSPHLKQDQKTIQAALSEHEPTVNAYSS